MRQQYDRFQGYGATVLAICPEGPDAVRAYWEQEGLPYAGLADPDHAVAKLYGQEVNLLRLGRMPTLVLLDAAGRVRYTHHATWMSDIPPMEKIFVVLDNLTKEEAP